ncbi:MBL fold metallo-hydrolase [Agitococcus lubricus]|uniref:L-ascorbate metabolism protein UlaG (Beta-lactamase superfamily) n=1 Tax=Agitococcus lubricus TaxID=1077255 RepID=A0A2T5J114_9GAMM|nr:MBL fold metallo-hydrolase [Agitococcus lubricus]PTQ90082.1 L-ascorbate metabolism protein UlaG (beta-lactamase superfamily) [Agitococcus lubricus]
MTTKTYSLPTKNVTNEVWQKPNLEVDLSYYNGQTFYNPWQREERNNAALFKWILTRENKTWPQQQNQPCLEFPLTQYSEQLSDWKLWFVGHATVLLQIGKYNFLTDPVWAQRCSPFAMVGPKRVRPAGIALEDIPPLTAVLLSHNHYDHLDTATLLWLHQRDQMPIITGLGNGVYLRQYGMKVIELAWWQHYTCADGVDIHYLPAKHFSGRGVRDRNAALWGSLSVNTAFGYAYFAGDTGYAPHFREIYQQLGAPRLALLPIGAYEPRALMKQVHMNPQDAVQAHRDLQAELSVGIHFNTFQLTDEAIDQPVQRLNQLLIENTLNPFIVLAEGEGYCV